jgi:hypothetical protein
MIINIRSFSFFFAFIFLFSCSEIRLIQEYDAVSDNKINSLQEKTSRFFVKINRTFGLPENKYDKYIDFYDDLKSDIHILEIRTKSIEKTNITQQQVTSLLTQVNTLENLHKIGFKNREEISLIESAFDNTFTAILQLQQALKNKRN